MFMFSYSADNEKINGYPKRGESWDHWQNGRRQDIDNCGTVSPR